MIMYDFLIALQYIGIAILFIELIYVLYQRPSVPQSLIFVFIISTLVNLTGYLFEMKATSIDTAIQAVKFSYLGKPFIAFSMFLFIMQYCKVTIPKPVTFLLAMFHVFTSGLVITCEHHTLFYSSISFTTDGLFPHLVFGHGIWYILNLSMIVVYTVSILITCIRTYRKTTSPTEHQQILYLFSMLIIADTGLALFLSGVTAGYDTTVFSYVLASFVFLLALFRHNLFDTLSLAKDYVVDNLSDGLVVLDTSNHLIYSNPPARRLYPALDSKDYENAILDLQHHYEKNEKLSGNGYVYDVSCLSILHKNIFLGNMYLLTDITDSYHYTERLHEEVTKKTKELVRIQHSIIASFASIVEARDGITGQHIKRTSAYVSIIARGMQKSETYAELLTDHEISMIIDAAPLHDIGKIAVPDAILTKPGKLTDEEFAIIKTHPAKGAQIIDESLSDLEDPEYLDIARQMALYHHEKWDGTGYPYGLSGEAIPICARIMAIADVYDALRSKRSYKDAFSKEKALSIIKESSGSHFDPAVVAVFVDNIDKIEQL